MENSILQNQLYLCQFSSKKSEKITGLAEGEKSFVRKKFQSLYIFDFFLVYFS